MRYRFQSQWSNSTVLKEYIDHYKRARAKGLGVDADYSMGFMRRPMEFHIHDQIDQLNTIERQKLFRQGSASSVPDPGCASLLKSKKQSASTSQTESCPGGVSLNKCQSVAILLRLQPSPETPRRGKAMHAWGQVQSQTRTHIRQSVR